MNISRSRKVLIVWSIFLTLLIIYLNLALFIDLTDDWFFVAVFLSFILNSLLIPILLIPWVQIYYVKDKEKRLHKVLFTVYLILLSVFIFVVLLFVLGLTT